MPHPFPSSWCLVFGWTISEPGANFLQQIYGLFHKEIQVIPFNALSPYKYRISVSGLFPAFLSHHCKSSIPEDNMKSMTEMGTNPGSTTSFETWAGFFQHERSKKLILVYPSCLSLIIAKLPSLMFLLLTRMRIAFFFGHQGATGGALLKPWPYKSSSRRHALARVPSMSFTNITFVSIKFMNHFSDH